MKVIMHRKMTLFVFFVDIYPFCIYVVESILFSLFLFFFMPVLIEMMSFCGM